MVRVPMGSAERGSKRELGLRPEVNGSYLTFAISRTISTTHLSANSISRRLSNSLITPYNFRFSTTSGFLFYGYCFVILST